MNNLKNEFKNKRVFITGHTGFKGSWMCIWLQMLGANIKGYSLKPEKDSLYDKIKHRLEVKSVFADILDKEKLRKEITSFRPDYIFHLAAQSLVRESYRVPVETFETNVIGTAHVLEALRFVKGKCNCIIVTTDKVYENLEKDYEYKEIDKLGGYDPYSASKAAAEIIVESYRLSFFNPANYAEHKKSVASARAGNVIGGGDYAKDRILPDIFRALSKSKMIQVRNPRSIRPWQHVLEPLSGYLALAASMNSNPGELATSFNFGPASNDTMTVEELVRLAIKQWGKGKYSLTKLKVNLHEAGLLKLDINKAKKVLGWNPKWNAKEAISKSVNWYKMSRVKGIDPFDLCVNDINEYESN